MRRSSLRRCAEAAAVVNGRRKGENPGDTKGRINEDILRHWRYALFDSSSGPRLIHVAEGLETYFHLRDGFWRAFVPKHLTSPGNL